MKYHTINELDHFCFNEAYIAQICAMSGMFEIVFDNVTILPSAGYPGELVYVSKNLPLSSFEFFTEDTYGIQYSQQSHTDIGKDSRPQSDESTSTGNQNQ